MAYQNNYSTALAGIDEARLRAIKQLILDSLSDLNIALNRDTDSPMTFTAQEVVFGDPETISTSLICITGGGKQDATDFETEPRIVGFTSDNVGYRYTLYAVIYIYIHPDEMPDPDPVVYTAYREIAKARISDHFRRRVFNAKANSNITLTSQEFSGSGVPDFLQDCYCKVGKKGGVWKNAGAAIWVPDVELMVCGKIE